MIGFSARMLKFLLVGALLAGTMHNMLILGTADLGQLWESSSDMGTAIGVWFVWLTMTTVVTSFIANGERFAEIGRDYLEVDLLEPDHMQLVGRAAMMPTLGIIGTQSFYPLLWIGGNNDLAAALPGFVATTVSLAYLFLRSTLPIHRRIKALKHKELQKISRAISEARSGWSGSPSQELISLLNYRG